MKPTSNFFSVLLTSSVIFASAWFFCSSTLMILSDFNFSADHTQFDVQKQTVQLNREKGTYCCFYQCGKHFMVFIQFYFCLLLVLWLFFSPLASQVSTSCLRCWNVLCSLFFHLLVFWLWYFCCFYWFLSFLLWAFLLTLFLFVLLLVLLFLLMFLIFPHLLLLLLLIVTFFCCCLHCFYLFPAVYLSCAVVSNVSTYVWLCCFYYFYLYFILFLLIVLFFL